MDPTLELLRPSKDFGVTRKKLKLPESINAERLMGISETVSPTFGKSPPQPMEKLVDINDYKSLQALQDRLSGTPGDSTIKELLKNLVSLAVKRGKKWMNVIEDVDKSLARLLNLVEFLGTSNAASLESMDEKRKEIVAELSKNATELSDDPKNKNNRSALVGTISKCKDLNVEISSLITLGTKMSFVEARAEANPFGSLGNSLSKHRTFVKLANIDAVFSVTGYTYDPSGTDPSKEMMFADLAGAPGGFIQYIQYRLLNSKGYGMSLDCRDYGIYKHACEWDRESIDTRSPRFKILEGLSGGNLFLEWRKFIKDVGRTSVNLVTADGAINVKGREMFQEQENTRMVVVQALIAISILRHGGSFVLKIFDIATKPIVDVLYILSNLFEEVYVFKPISSRPANSEKYVVCREFDSTNTMVDNFARDLASR